MVRAPHRSIIMRRFGVRCRPTAGRVQELASLTRWLDEAFSGQPRLVTLYGETGTGTAMLMRQLESEVRVRGGLFAMAASTNQVPQPYGVWSELLRATNRSPINPPRVWKELHHLEPTFGQPADASAPTGSQYRLLGELTSYIRARAAERPLVIVLDEMQWADTTSWDALEHLLSQLDTDPIMVYLTQRPDSTVDSAEHQQMLKRHEFARELMLSRLTRDEVKQWLEAAFHRQQAGREFLAFLYRHTEGNPLFITQLLRALVEDGAIWYSGNRWEWTPVSELRLPGGRSALIAQRLANSLRARRPCWGPPPSPGASSTFVCSWERALVASRLYDSRSRSALAGLLHNRRTTPGSSSRTTDRRGAGRVDSSRTSSAVAPARGPIARQHRRVGEIAFHFDAAGESADAYRWAQIAAKCRSCVRAWGGGAYLQMAARNATTPASSRRFASLGTWLKPAADTTSRRLCDLAIEWFEGSRTNALSATATHAERARMEQGQPARDVGRADRPRRRRKAPRLRSGARRDSNDGLAHARPTGRDATCRASCGRRR
jgi:hypothetical protein